MNAPVTTVVAVVYTFIIDRSWSVGKGVGGSLQGTVGVRVYTVIVLNFLKITI